MKQTKELIMIVEDDRQIQDFIAYSLMTAGFGVLTAGGVEEAMRKMRSKKPDIMVLDLGLPDGDGLDLIREERSRMGAEVSVRGLKINFDAKEVTLDGNLLHVTPLEYQLLELLFHNIGKVITTRTLLDELYGVSYGDNTQSLRALMAGLRRKIEKVPGKPQYIVTEIGVGYRLKDE